MKKILSLFLALFTINACSDSPILPDGEYTGTSSTDFPITIIFDDVNKTVYGKVVNNFNGTYTITDNAITFGPIATTRMMGPPMGMISEGNFMQFLDAVKTIETTKTTVTLTTNSGEKMTFTKK